MNFVAVTIVFAVVLTGKNQNVMQDKISCLRYVCLF